MLYSGNQLAGLVANNSSLKCTSGKGSCASTPLNMAIFSAGALDGGDAVALGLDAERMAKAGEEFARLYRCGTEYESTERLAAQAAEAEAKGFPP